jgi:hypothetical protein
LRKYHKPERVAILKALIYDISIKSGTYIKKILDMKSAELSHVFN